MVGDRDRRVFTPVDDGVVVDLHPLSVFTSTTHVHSSGYSSTRSRMVAVSSVPTLVLTNSSLFQEITAFIPGVPHFLLTFKKQEYRKYLAATKPRTAGYITQQKPKLTLWQVAVHCDNKRVLKALYELAKIPAYQSSPHVQFKHLLGFALTYLQSGDVELLDWIYENSPDGPEDSESSRSNHHQVTSEQFEELAVKLENLRVAEWIRNYDCVFPACMMDAAAASGNLELVQEVHEHGTKEYCHRRVAVGFAVLVEKAKHSHMPVLHRLHLCLISTPFAAVYVKKLHDFEMPVAHRAVHRAGGASLGAMKGGLECVKFAHDHGFTGFVNSVMSYAILWGHVDVVQFLHANRPRKRYTLGALMAAERLGHHGVVDYLCRNRPVEKPVPAFWEAVAQGQLRLAAKLLLHSSVAWLTASERYKYPQTHPKGCSNA